MASSTLTFDQAVNQIVNLVSGGASQKSLVTYHAVGKIVADAPGGYGANKHAKLAELLERKRVEGLDVSNLYKAEKFATEITQPEAQQLDRHKISWRAAARLCSKHLTQAKRQQLIRDVVSGEIAPEDLGRRIDELSGVKAKRGARSVRTAIERAKEEVDFLLKVVRGRGGDEDLKNEAFVALYEIRKLIDEKMP